jgi:phage-related minor tail protein
LNFQLAFGARVGQRLAEAKAEAEREADRQDRPGTALALRNKDLELKSFYRQTSSARGTWRASSASAGYSSAARRAGDRAGKHARLGPSQELPGARTPLRP